MLGLPRSDQVFTSSFIYALCHYTFTPKEIKKQDESSSINQDAIIRFFIVIFICCLDRKRSYTGKTLQGHRPGGGYLPNFCTRVCQHSPLRFLVKKIPQVFCTRKGSVWLEMYTRQGQGTAILAGVIQKSAKQPPPPRANASSSTQVISSYEWSTVQGKRCQCCAYMHHFLIYPSNKTTVKKNKPYGHTVLFKHCLNVEG